MSIKHLKSLGKHTAGQVRTEGPYTNTFRASAPAWTLNEMVNYKTDDSFYSNGINMRWPLDMARDSLLMFLNPNDDQSACVHSGSWGNENAALDNLADGYTASEVVTVNPKTLNYFQDNSSIVTYDDYIYLRRWRFCERVQGYEKTSDTVMLTDTNANNAKYIDFTDWRDYNSEYGSIPSPFVFDSTHMASRTGNDRVKNITMQIFVKLQRNDQGPIMKSGYQSILDGAGAASTQYPDGYGFGVAAGQTVNTSSNNNSNIFHSGLGNRLVVRYPYVRNFTSNMVLPTGVWHMVTFIINDNFSPTLYLDDGVGTGKSWTWSGTNYVPRHPNTWMNIAMNNGDVVDGTQSALKMGQGITLAYAKALSQEEVAQNWNAFKGFYGIT